MAYFISSSALSISGTRKTLALEEFTMMKNYAAIALIGLATLTGGYKAGYEAGKNNEQQQAVQRVYQESADINTPMRQWKELEPVRFTAEQIDDIIRR
ncbi:MAG: hypothetical protein QS99_C0001G0088 [archaeon GW2011_AR4]|nr:MAG: hypothetical protein QS99_C0001G0088 [archaeon GW2011_AR4]